MPYTQTSWVNGTTPANATNMNHVETQYTEATLSLGPDLVTAGFVLSGLLPTGTVATTTVNVAAGTAYLLQTDGTTRQRKLTSSTQTTSTPSTTYYLYLQPDGTWYWSTSNSPATNSLWIAQVTTNGSGQIATLTDKRSLVATLFPTAAGTLAVNTPVSLDTGLLTTDGLGTFSGKAPTIAAPTLATAASTTSATYLATVTADSPLRYYRMDASSGATETDHGSTAVNGTINGTVTYASGGLLTGDTDTSMTFNGNDANYVSAAGTGLPSGAPTGFTAECWVYLTGYSAGSEIPLSLGSTSANQNLNIQVDSTGHVTAHNSNVTTGSSAALSLNTPHHLVATYDGSKIHLYVDGAEVGTGTTATLNFNSFSSGGVDIGRYVLAGNPYSGRVDEVALYGTALSAARILVHYSIGKNGPDSQTLPGVGAYQYAVTYVTATSETAPGTAGSISTTTGHQKVSISAVPTGPIGTTSRKVYRTVLGGSAFFLLTTLSDNTTTTYTDQTTDASLGAAAATHPTAGGDVWKNAAGTTVAQVYGDGYANFAGFSAGIPSVNGQATAGTFGVPVVVAQVIAQHITTTGNTHLIDYAVAAAGVYRVSMFITFSNVGGAQTLWAFTLSADGTYTSTHGYFTYLASTPVVMNGSNSVAANQGIVTNPQTIYAAAGTTISAAFQDPGGTPNDFVTVIIERLT